MAEECAESCSVVTSSTTAVVPPGNWWDLHGASGSALSSWFNNHTSNSNNNNNHNNSNIPWQHLAKQNPNSNNSDEDVSISTSFTTDHSGLTVESSRRFIEPAASSSNDLIGPPDQPSSDGHIWSQVFLNVGNNNNGDLQSQQDVGENFLDMLSSSKNIFESDYLKKLDGSNTTTPWDHHHHHHHQLSNPNSSPNGLMINTHNNLILVNNNNNSLHSTPAMTNAETDQTKLSNLLSTWSIAPPESAENRGHFPVSTPPPPQFHHLHHRRFLMKQPFLGAAANNNHPGLFAPCYTGHNDTKIADNIRLSYHNDNNNNNIDDHHHQVGLINMVGDNNNINNYETINNSIDDSYNYSGDGSAKNYSDVISFSGRLGRPLIDNNNKACGAKSSLSLSESKKQGRHTSSSSSSPPITRSGGRGNSTSEAKKKRCEDTNHSETNLKKPKQESSTASSTKIQVPKVKLGDKITALQQIVSPFGKTDTASVLYEAIQYIKFLEEQVQLLSNPYLKTNSHKDHWGNLERKVDHLKADHHRHNHNHNHNHNHLLHHHQHPHIKVDLRSRGLCLIPVSCTPQVYRENTGSDYWTPTYRGCLYR